MTKDRIERSIVLRAPHSRVWKALSDSEQFGTWFGVRLEGPFVPGRRVQGQITHPGYEHLTMDLTVERIEPEHLFSYRWHPYAVDPDVDYSKEPTTLVEFHLEEVDEGTRLRVVESGFDGIPIGRRAEAFRMNSEGWTHQMQNLERYVSS
jgi:uncharacterized protein YndB with AHSA1/START domain